MKNKILLLFFLGIVFGVYADGLKSITINEIGEHDVSWNSVIINTHAQEQGLQPEGRRFFYCYAVTESTFDEIMVFINNNMELFEDKQLLFIEKIGDYSAGPYGSVELFIENEGREYYLYLIERRSSAIFFYGLLEIIRNNGNYNELATKLESSIRYFGFDKIIGTFSSP